MSSPRDTVSTSSALLVADDEGLRFRFDSSSALDVLFDGRRVWSISPPDFKRDADGYRYAPWPDLIRSRLEGRATVEIRDHVNGRSLAVTESTFGSGKGQVTMVDELGRPVALTKHGRFNRPFESTDRSVIEGYLDQVEDALEVLREDCGLPAFISFGTLLGAVRSGKLIGHDVDVDLGYLSAYEYPVDVIRESMRVERVFRSKGWKVIRQNGGFLALFLPQSDGGSRNLDVFSCFIVNGMLHQVHDVRTKADRSAVLPLKEIQFEGRTLPAPAKPRVFLRAAYGPGWRVPDPSFQYHTPRPTKRRVNGWLGGLRARRDKWVAWHNNPGDDAALRKRPSDFSQWLAARESPAVVVELGCGAGGDAVYLATQGHTVTAVDFAPGALLRARRLATSAGVAVDFRTVNMYSVRETLTLAALLAATPGRKIVYVRRLLEDLRPTGLDNFWRTVRALARNGSVLYLEFQTDGDLDALDEQGPPGQYFVDAAEVEAEAVARGATIVHREQVESTSDQPRVCRMILEW
ncbi:MAG TPA: class I SAM-dependent methyltransferase [Nocardioidaceae bacterium]|nr:class I SAM-dependent methyltransferase [Nocardioidaceae bacterium]